MKAARDVACGEIAYRLQGLFRRVRGSGLVRAAMLRLALAVGQPA